MKKLTLIAALLAACLASNAYALQDGSGEGHGSDRGSACRAAQERAKMDAQGMNATECMGNKCEIHVTSCECSEERGQNVSPNFKWGCSSVARVEK